jgi:hypothetical protein
MSNSSIVDSCERICLTPTRNEAWIIQPFLAAAKLWASNVIVADQCSTDGTWQQIQSTPNVEGIVNESSVYDEAHRQRLLLRQARRREGKRVLIALDADEALSANFMQSKEWSRICAAPPGTVLRFRWINILPGWKTAWIPPQPMACGFIDDGSDHVGERIHSRRVPWPENAPVLDLDEIVVLHFQYVAPERATSKHRWYQAWEYMNRPEAGALRIFRQYNHMNGSWGTDEVHPVRPEWLAGYDQAGVDFRSLAAEPVTWWDREIVKMFCQHGPAYFRRVAIWNHDWNGVAQRLGVQGVDFADPRSAFEKVIHRLLASTQRRRGDLTVRGLEKFLRFTGW